jgi:hypothetical protein
MSNTNATTLNINAMGIQEFDAAIKQGLMQVKDVLDVLDARIAKRKQAGKNLIAGVVKYRNDLAATYLKVTGHDAGQVPLPAYASKPIAALPSDPVQAADALFQHVGPANVAAVISRLTEIMVATSTKAAK